MIFAKYKKQLGLWFVLWCFVLASMAMDWDRQSPLLWHNAWGVIEWLGSSAIFAALWEGTHHEVQGELSARNRLQGIVTSLYSLARDVARIALLLAIAALRIALYRGEVRADLAWLYSYGPEPFILHFPYMIGMIVGGSAVGRFLARINAALFRSYDGPSDQITPR